MYKFTVQAKRDLDQIRDYTLETSGADQAYLYVGELRGGFESVDHDPGVGKARPDLANGMRSFAVGRHLVFYTRHEGDVIIVRILHQRMDPHPHM